VKGTQHLAAAKAYLNYMTSPEALVKFAWGRQKIMVTNSKVADLLKPEQVKILNLDAVDSWAKRLRLNRAPDDEEGWKKAWQKFKAA
jgi:ABC-type Fe3+ transport system substrate-binding protein